MGKIALVFPGQGSQYVGMGKDLYDQYPEARVVFEEADQVLGQKISDTCFNGPEMILKDTRNAQPAILTTSVAAFRVLTAAGVRPDFVAGHSLGEYSALVAVGAITFSDALCLVKKRSNLMAEADPAGNGTMAAILGLEREAVINIMAEAADAGRVEAANFNCPGQVVVSGEKAGMVKVQALTAEQGGKFIPLAVSGPFHSSFMKEAAETFRTDLNSINWIDPQMPLIANVSASPVSAANMVQSLYQQLFSSVLWEDTVRRLHQEGVKVFVEVGPGKVLTGLIKKTLKEATLLNCEDSGSLKKALAILKEV